MALLLPGEVVEEAHDGCCVGFDEHGSEGAAAMDGVEEGVYGDHLLVGGFALRPFGGEFLEGGGIAAGQERLIYVGAAPGFPGE